MPKFENTMGITEISFTHSTRCYCPLGDDYYTGEIFVIFVPGDTIPDYLDVQKEIDTLTGEHFNGEGIVEKVFDIMLEYQPKELTVAVDINDAGHFPVSIIKEL